MTSTTVPRVSDSWTFARFEYEFFLCLSRVSDPNKCNSVTRNELGLLSDKKYYNQARAKMYWIPISKPNQSVPFVVNLSDLTPRLKSEFQEFCQLNKKREITLFLKDIATKFFENLDYEYTHDSVVSYLRVVVRA